MPRFAWFLVATIVLVPGVLLAERAGAPQIALGAVTAAFLWWFARSSPIPRRQILIAVIIATIGEVVLSIGWGLYEYRHAALIPLYVPVGHGVFYLLAAESAEQPSIRRHTRTIARLVLAGGTLLAATTLYLANDTWGFLWWVFAATLLVRSRNQLLLSTCFVYTLLLEWLGTGLGNWEWAAVVPGLGLTCANPPSGVGLLYIVLDLLTHAMPSRMRAHSLRPSASSVGSRLWALGRPAANASQEPRP